LAIKYSTAVERAARRQDVRDIGADALRIEGHHPWHNCVFLVTEVLPP
jgi:hypothetical protein